MGGVYHEKAIIQPITDYVWMGGDPYDDEYLSKTAQILYAIRLGIEQLRQYYSSLNAKMETLDGTPYIRQFAGETFEYDDRKLVDTQPNKLIYRAKTKAGRQIVVKFVSRYNARAHHLLAQEGLAPKLLYPETEELEPKMFGKRYMVVMDYFEGKQAAPELSQEHFEQVKKAIDLLHSEDLVFGDLRPPNVLIGKEGIRLVDFDWCDKVGKGRYPVDINNGPDIRWPQGVSAGSVMEKEHDLAMLNSFLTAEERHD